MPEPRYGTQNVEYFGSILERAEPGGPMYALNFMKYREVADYLGDDGTTRSGADADNEYAPVEPLAAVGARIVFVASVEQQLVGDDVAWDRIAVVRYPTRRAIIDMSLRDDFRKKHVHKEAGMEFTIVVSSFVEEVVARERSDDLLLIQLLADADGPDLVDGVETTHLARFSVEDLMIGDGRRFAEARYDLVTPDAAEEFRSRAMISDDRNYAVLVAPTIDTIMNAAADDLAG